MTYSVNHPIVCLTLMLLLLPPNVFNICVWNKQKCTFISPIGFSLGWNELILPAVRKNVYLTKLALTVFFFNSKILSGSELSTHFYNIIELDCIHPVAQMKVLKKLFHREHQDGGREEYFIHAVFNPVMVLPELKVEAYIYIYLNIWRNGLAAAARKKWQAV